MPGSKNWPGLPADRERILLLHFWWDRAYLLLEQRDVEAARAARATYRSLARLPDEHDGLAVLDAFFAFKAGAFEAARLAAAEVNAAEDGDVQDLFVLWLAFDSANDRAAADAVLKLIREADVGPMKVLMIQVLATHGVDREALFIPRVSER